MCSSDLEVDSTNNRMEMTAAIKALEALKKPCVVELYTDSSYVKNAFEKNWLKNWQNNGWKSKGRKPVANKDLWLRLLEVSHKHEVSCIGSKGIPEIQKMTAATNLLFKPERNLQSPFNPQTPERQNCSSRYKFSFTACIIS